MNINKCKITGYLFINCYRQLSQFRLPNSNLSSKQKPIPSANLTSNTSKSHLLQNPKNNPFSINPNKGTPPLQSLYLSINPPLLLLQKNSKIPNKSSKKIKITEVLLKCSPKYQNRRKISTGRSRSFLIIKIKPILILKRLRNIARDVKRVWFL